MMANPRLAILALAAGAFAIGTTEFAPMGLLPVIARDLHVSVPRAGGLVSAYAFGVMLGAPFMTLLLGAVSRKRALVFLMCLYVVGNLGAGFSGTYVWLMVWRVVTSLSHGAFFGLGAVEASSLVPAERRASAVASMFMGLTIANIFGVPAATWLGTASGWRVAFLVTASLGVVAALALSLALPARGRGARPDILGELRVLIGADVLLALAVTTLGAGIMFVLYTYIAPFLHSITGASNALVTVVLMTIGVGFSLGAALGGRLADRSTRFALLCVFPVLGAIMLIYPALATTSFGAVGGILLWSTASFALMPALQMRTMQAASRAPALASSVNIGAFNLGNALGAWIGGLVLAGGLGYGAVSMSGTVLALIGFLIVLFTRSPVASAD
ncbi:MFS transporter [Swaminathania salitolerans]|uniref:MFS transporter n=1 Tax=Swaminathania salitolerans TaxID=182838 RepID=A0A511BMK3_9PROT|nr:MFS transporter [Swaminathania salitolerans]GBQ16012.1 transmembrane efflux protein [Swaminathania salitolerans LMG 21291]GEL01569.1 MFS transporter [Swaminathania salitolerans]